MSFLGVPVENFRNCFPRDFFGFLVSKYPLKNNYLLIIKFQIKNLMSDNRRSPSSFFNLQISNGCLKISAFRLKTSSLVRYLEFSAKFSQSFSDLMNLLFTEFYKKIWYEKFMRFIWVNLEKSQCTEKTIDLAPFDLISRKFFQIFLSMWLILSFTQIYWTTTHFF